MLVTAPLHVVHGWPASVGVTRAEGCDVAHTVLVMYIS